MGLFDGQIKTFATKFCTALEERAVERLGGKCEGGLAQSGNAIVAITLIDLAKVLRKVAEIG